jgi:hypothetical protein
MLPDGIRIEPGEVRDVTTVGDLFDVEGDIAWRRYPIGSEPPHFLVKRAPKFSDGDELDVIAKIVEEQDANALGLNVIWVTEYSEIQRSLVRSHRRVTAEPTR